MIYFKFYECYSVALLMEHHDTADNYCDYLSQLLLCHKLLFTKVYLYPHLFCKNDTCHITVIAYIAYMKHD